MDDVAVQTLPMKIRKVSFDIYFRSSTYNVINVGRSWIHYLDVIISGLIDNNSPNKAHGLPQHLELCRHRPCFENWRL